jgi:hypothetical protein
MLGTFYSCMGAGQRAFGMPAGRRDEILRLSAAGVSRSGGAALSFIRAIVD